MSGYCKFCGDNVCGYDQVISCASDQQLNSKEYYKRIWRVLTGLELKRRELRTYVIDLFCSHCCVTFVTDLGEAFDLPEMEDVCTKDEDCTWEGRFIKSDETGLNPKRFYNDKRYKDKYLPLLRVLDLAAKLIEPETFGDVE